MGLMDRVKAQATQLAQKTQEAAQEGKNRLDQAQASRRGDVLLRQLGAAVFADRTGRGTPDSQAKIDQLVSALSLHERENGLNLTQPTVPPPGSPTDQSTPADSTSDSTASSYSAGSDPAAGTDQQQPPQQDSHGGFQPGQTFFEPPADTEPGPDSPR